MNINKYLNKFIKDYQHFDVEAFIILENASKHLRQRI